MGSHSTPVVGSPAPGPSTDQTTAAGSVVGPRGSASCYVAGATSQRCGLCRAVRLNPRSGNTDQLTKGTADIRTYCEGVIELSAVSGQVTVVDHDDHTGGVDLLT